MKPKYNIGDEVYTAHFERENNWIQCPDCCGKRELTVTFGDDTSVKIKCDSCGPGYQDSRGVVNHYIWLPRVEKKKITGMKIDLDKIEYHAGTPSSYRTYKEEDLFLTFEDAEARAQEKAVKWQAEKDDEFKKKVKTNRSWSFNACYHRARIKQAKYDLDYHTKALNYAASLAKTTKDTK